jgi:hypothetical protein
MSMSLVLAPAAEDGCVGDGADSDSHLFFVGPIGEELRGKPRKLLQGGAPAPGEAPKERSGGCVRRGDRGLEEAHPVVADESGEGPVEQPGGQSAPTVACGHADLPDEVRLGTFGRSVAEQKARQLAVGFCDRTRLGEIAAEKQVRVGRVGIEGAGLLDQLPDVGGVRRTGGPDRVPPMIWRADIGSPGGRYRVVFIR